jgi:hypothetical protein
VIDFPPLISTSSSHLFTFYLHSISFFLYPFPPPSVPLRSDLLSDPPSRTSYSECYPAGEWRACLVLGSSSLFFSEALTEQRVTHQVTLAVLLAVVFSIGVSGEGQDGRAERGREGRGGRYRGLGIKGLWVKRHQRAPPRTLLLCTRCPNHWNPLLYSLA